MKEYLIYILLALSGIGVWYLGTAFVLLEINFINWDEGTRFLVLMEGVVTSLGAIAIYKVNAKDTTKDTTKKA